jgi:hypothetical protein
MLVRPARTWNPRTPRGLLATVLIAASIETALTDDRSTEDLAFFETSIRPLLAEKCYACHSSKSKSLEAGLRVDSRAGLLQGGDSGPALVPGDPEASLVIRAVRYEDPALQMPPRSRLSEREIAALERWIQSGAPDPRTEPLASSALDVERSTFDIESARGAHWAWKAPVEHALPSISDRAWPRNSIDRWILAALEARNLAPSPEADRRAWLRRVTFDLTGLPPTPEELADYLADAERLGEAASLADERVVDRLLSSPAYGERQGVHWLDLVRFAETFGHEGDSDIPEAYRYRNYVVRAWNADVPYDELLVEHIAGDLLEAPRIDPFHRTNESAQGPGFWHLGEASHSPVDIRGEEADRVANQLDAFSKAFQGLSIGCARCHDHKFDPIPQKDYYALFGYLQSSGWFIRNVADPERSDSVISGISAAREAAEQEAGTALRAAWRKRLVGFETRLLESARLARDPNGGRDSNPELTANIALARAIETARGDPSSPLHVFASVALDDAGTVAERVEAALARNAKRVAAEHARAAQGVTEVTVEEGERNYVTRQRPASPEDVVVDYDEAFDPNSSRRIWFAGDRAFGAGPRPIGTLRLGTDLARPILGFRDDAEATVESTTPRATGLLRTSTFEVTSNTLWYRYRGAAEVFLAVDSHRVVQGPLHGVVRQQLADSKNAVRWQSHDVRDYIGHRVHVEFTPRSADFALFEVRFSRDEPLPRPRVQPFLTSGFEAVARPESIDDVARSTVRFLRAAVESLDGGRVSGADPEFTRDLASIWNWLLAHDAAFTGNSAADAFDRRVAEIVETWLERRAELEAGLPDPILALSLLDGDGEDEPVHVRGNHRTLSPRVEPRHFLTAAPAPKALALAPQYASGRLELARLLVDPSQPLTARVAANRVWHHLFGRGIVATVDDFGRMGDAPTHPELLDMLALGLERNGWSLKQLYREIVLSSTYRQSSRPRPGVEELDPANLLLHRMPVRRLTAEAIRDSLLAVSGRLDRRMEGRSVPAYIAPFQRGNRSPGHSGPADGDGRRSVWLEVRRNHLSHFLTTFDRPVPFAAVGRRNVSNSPAQPLLLLNDPFVHDQARRWAERLLTLHPGDQAKRLDRLWLEAFARSPSQAEANASLAFVAETVLDGVSELEAWIDLCHTAFNAKEFTYLD